MGISFRLYTLSLSDGRRKKVDENSGFVENISFSGESDLNEKEGYFYPLILTNPMEVVYENE